MNSFVLLTAARNEAAHLERTAASVAAQTAPPLRWILVDDGSTDATPAQVDALAGQHPFIEPVHRPPSADRSFRSKALALNEGYERVRRLTHQYVAILDADVTLEPDYYARVLAAMDSAPDLGVAGGVLYDRIGGRYVRQDNAMNWSVGGPVQTFRRACWEQIGGYFPSSYGGVDAIAEVMSRMRGWRVKTLPDIPAYHQRPTGSEGQARGRAWLKLGTQNYLIGYHPLFMAARCLRQAFRPPWIIGGLALAAGYAAAVCRRRPRELPADFVRFLRAEQLRRLVGSSFHDHPR
jgi:biofilm PGA synthesis N-glycosyltransferase PgaC